MATMNGTILRADTKTSAKGNTYHRLQVAVDGGGEKWYTYFGTLHGNYVGAACVFALKEGKARDGYPPDLFIEDYNILGEGAAPMPTAPDTSAAAATYQAAVTTQPAKVGGHKDMWIFSECVYQHWINNCSAVRSEEVERMVKDSIKSAILANEAFKAYDKDGKDAALKLLNPPATSPMAARVEEMQQQAQAQYVNDPAPGDSFDPDQDIPF